MENANNTGIKIKEIHIQLSNGNIFKFSLDTYEKDNEFEFKQIMQNTDVIENIIYISDTEFTLLEHTNEFKSTRLFLIERHIEIQINPNRKAKLLTFMRGSFFDIFMDRLSVKIEVNNQDLIYNMRDFIDLVKLSFNCQMSGNMKMYTLDKDKFYKNCLCFVPDKNEVSFWKI